MDGNNIYRFFHCARCVREKPRSESMEKWARLNVGLTLSGGLQVWCVRHRLDVVTLKAAELERYAATGLPCTCCPGGVHDADRGEPRH